MSKVKKYSIPKRVDAWMRNTSVHLYHLIPSDEDALRRAIIRLMREAYKKGQEEERQASHQECQAAYDAGLMAGRREQNK